MFARQNNAGQMRMRAQGRGKREERGVGIEQSAHIGVRIKLQFVDALVGKRLVVERSSLDFLQLSLDTLNIHVQAAST